MEVTPLSRLLTFARELQRAATFEELLGVAQAELLASLGYAHAWLFVAETEDAEEMRLIDIAGSKRGQVREEFPVLRVKGDAMLEQIVRSDVPIVIEDARTDPRTDKKIVERLGNRTIINLPLRLLDKPLGALGTGTFGDEGCRPPTPEHLDYLIGMASQLTVAAGRIRFLEERARAEQLRTRDAEAAATAAAAAALEKARLYEDLERALKLRDEFIAAAAHGLRTPATVMTLAAARLKTGVAEVRERHIRRIHAATRQVVRLADELDMADRLARGALERRRSTLDLGELVATRVRRVESLAPIVLTREPGVSVPANLEQLGLVLDVLLDKAVRQRREGLAIEVGVRSEPDEAIIEVCDKGAGIHPERLCHIFEPLFEPWPSGSPYYTGAVGLGLYLSKHLVELHGGRLEVDSHVDQGTTYRVRLPRQGAAHQCPGPPRE